MKKNLEFLFSFEKEMLENYWEIFSNHFVNSAAWAIMKRQKIIWEKLDFTVWENWNNYFVSFSFWNNFKYWWHSKLELWRNYNDEEKTLYFVKSKNEINWTFLTAIKDSLEENKLIFDNLIITK